MPGVRPLGAGHPNHRDSACCTRRPGSAGWPRHFIAIAREEPPRRRFIAGADLIGSAERKVADLHADIDLDRDRFISLDMAGA